MDIAKGHRDSSAFPRTFLSSPINTIVASTEFTYHLSRHDLLEAYHTLNLRLITLSNGVEGAVVDYQRATMQMEALAPLKSNAPMLIEALKRDIRGALVNPLPATSHSATYPYNLSSIYQDSDFMSQSQVDLTPDDVQRATEVVMLCHYSLQVVSIMFHSSVLQELFEVEDLASLLESVLSLWTPAPLPSPNSGKTRAFVIWVLKVQRLPAAVLSSKYMNERILSVMKVALEDEGTTVVSDCLQAFKHLLISSPAFYLEALSNCLPRIILFLVSTEVELQYKSAELLGTLGVLLLHHPNTANRGKGKGIQVEVDVGDVWEACANHVRSFIDSQTSRRCTTPIKLRLRHILSAALVTPTAKQGDSQGLNNSTLTAAWSIHVLFNLIILSSSPSRSLFMHASSLKLFFALVGDAISNPQKDIRRAGEHGWRLLLWAFWKLYQTNGSNEIVRKAFKTVKQELRGGTGGLLVAILLHDKVSDGPEHQSGSRSGSQVGYGADEAVEMALEVVGDMISSPRKLIARDGVELLARLVAIIGASASTIPSPPSTPAQWIPSHALELSFIDGKCLAAGLSVSLDASVPVPDEALKQLSDREIMTFWDLLKDVWISAVRRFLVEALPDNDAWMKQRVFNHLVQIWQSLLLAQAQLTQGHEHLTSHSAFAQRVVSIISTFLEDKVAPVTADAEKARLDLVSKLWRLMENTFSASWLFIPAKYLLGTVAGLKFNLADEGVKRSWEILINGLGAAGDDLLLGLLDHQSHQSPESASMHHQAVETSLPEPHQKLFRRQLWCVVATRSKDASHDGRIRWTDVVDFLSVPFGNWVMADSEVQLWSDMLQFAIVAARSVSVKPVVVVEEIFLKVSERKIDRRSSRFFDVATLLISNIDISSSTSVPEDVFIMIDDILQNLYPPQTNDLHDSLQFFTALKAVIIACPPSLLLPVLVTIQNGLCIWILDKDEAVSNASFNDVIIPIYTEIISKLPSVSPGLDALNALTPLLVSAFTQTQARPGAIGPLAFETFWKVTYHGQDDVLRDIPPRLKDCVKSFDFVFERGLAAGLSHDSQSQSTTGSIVPDSQHSRAAPDAVKEPLELTIGLPGSRQTTPRATAHVAESVLVGVDRSSSPISLRDEIAMDSSSILGGLQTLTPSHVREGRAPMPPRSAFAQLRSYSSRDLHESDESGLSISQQSPSVQPRSSQRRKVASSSDGSLFGSLKRPSGATHDRPAKRAKTDPNVSRNQDSALTDGLQHSEEISVSKGRSVSVPLGASEYPVDRLPSSSEPVIFQTRLKFDGVEVPTLKQIWARESRAFANIRQEDSPPDSDDFDSWEAGLSLSDLRSLHSGDVSVPTTQMWDTSESEIPRTSSPELGEMLVRRSPSPFRRAHSQSAVQISPKPPLRRAKTTTDRLKILYYARKLIENDASQMADQDVAEGCRLASEIQATMSAQLARRLGVDSRPG